MNAACRILTMRAASTSQRRPMRRREQRRGGQGEYYTTCARNKTARVTIMQKYLTALTPCPRIPSPAFFRAFFQPLSFVFSLSRVVPLVFLSPRTPASLVEPRVPFFCGRLVTSAITSLAAFFGPERRGNLVGKGFLGEYEGWNFRGWFFEVD